MSLWSLLIPKLANSTISSHHVAKTHNVNMAMELGGLAVNIQLKKDYKLLSTFVIKKI